MVREVEKREATIAPLLFDLITQDHVLRITYLLITKINP